MAMRLQVLKSCNPSLPHANALATDGDGGRERANGGRTATCRHNRRIAGWLHARTATQGRCDAFARTYVYESLGPQHG